MSSNHSDFIANEFIAKIDQLDLEDFNVFDGLDQDQIEYKKALDK